VLELILGGARSGKSRLAEQRAGRSGLKHIYVATAQAGDAEMTARIHVHQQQRGDQWSLVEEPIALARVLSQHADADTNLLVDCLTLWLSNLLHHQDGRHFAREREALLAVLPTLPGHIVLVMNTVGMGVVPLGELNRQFVDQSGFLEQAVAALCDRVTLTVAGLPMVLKG
jgi:adenosylcobinamide kinase/adenosylcobinamide-phosphate guanylyltransferase